MRGLRQCLKRCRKLTARLWGLHRWAEKLRFVSKRGREEAMTRCFTLKARLHALWPSSLSAPGMNGSVEQESFRGPRKYKTVDGEFQESITLTYDTVAISGFPINELSVVYSGEDPALVWPRKLSLEAIRPTLARWGY